MNGEDARQEGRQAEGSRGDTERRLHPRWPLGRLSTRVLAQRAAMWPLLPASCTQVGAIPASDPPTLGPKKWAASPRKPESGPRIQHLLALLRDGEAGARESLPGPP